MIARINRLTSLQAAFIFATTGAATFFTGLGNPFMGDDLSQIVNNPPVHSIGNIGQFFTESTFYVGQTSQVALHGAYYRPLQTTVYSLLYTTFGANPVYFHIFQLLLCVLSTIILYHFLKYSFKTTLSLFLSLVFLLHPANSQVVFSIPYMQDALFFFFGILALWLLLRFRSATSLFVVALCLFLSLLSKETGILFIAMALIFLWGWDRRRLFAFMGILVVPVGLWLLLRINAVGLNTNPSNAPIDALSLGGRLLTAPSIILFYIGKFVWPLPLASEYFWVHPTFSFQDFVLPLLIDLVVVGVVVYAGFAIRRKGTFVHHRTFGFFAVWTALGLLAHLQVIPLDETASESYLYFPMVGILGMIGIAASVWAPAIHVDRRRVMAAASLLLVLFVLRTSLRGTDWSSPQDLAQHDIAVSPEDFNADLILSYQSAQQGNLSQAKEQAAHSVSVYPTYRGYVALGSMLTYSEDYQQAKDAYLAAIRYEISNPVPVADDTVAADDMAVLTMWYGDESFNKAFLLNAVQVYPQDGQLWYYLAIFFQRSNDNKDAKIAITQAYKYGKTDQYLLNQITNNQPVSIPSHPPPPQGLPPF